MDQTTINAQETAKTYSFKPSLMAYKEKLIFGIFLFAVIGFAIKNVIDRNMFNTQNHIFLAVAGLALLMPFSYLFKLYMNTKSTTYILSPQRLTVKKGYVSRTVSNLELWRVSDIQLHQTSIQLMFGECSVDMVTKDVSNPTLKITGLKKNKGEKIYNIINDYVAAALKTGGVMNTIR